MKKISTFLFFLFLLSFNVFAQENTTKKKSNSFIDYMKGKSIIGFNFSPAIYTGVTIGVFNTAGKQLIANETGLENAKMSGYGMSFNYDFAVLNFMAISVEAGFTFLDYKIGDRNLRYDTILWSAGVKFFTGKNAPYGFFLFPKIGGTDLKIRGNALQQLGTGNIYSHGIYLSLELGWRIQLFPKKGADWPVQAAIDISLFDIGYYVVPWASQLFNIDTLSGFKQFSTFANIKFVLFPRIGFSLRF